MHGNNYFIHVSGGQTLTYLLWSERCKAVHSLSPAPLVTWMYTTPPSTNRQGEERHLRYASVFCSPCRELFPDNNQCSIHYPLHNERRHSIHYPAYYTLTCQNETNFTQCLFTIYLLPTFVLLISREIVCQRRWRKPRPWYNLYLTILKQVKEIAVFSRLAP